MTKLHAPPVRSETVARERLFARLEPEAGIRLTVVAAPAGSGKTTLLAAWREHVSSHRPVAWVSLDDGDNDPVALWSHVVEALVRACPSLAVPHLPERIGGAHILDLVLPGLVNGISEQEDLALVLDDFHRLGRGPSRDGVRWLVEHAPPSFQPIIATRSEPALRLGALRAHGELCELRAADLEFTADEAELFLNGRLELGLTRGEVDLLVARTEGWAAGLYLAALSLQGAADRHAFVTAFGGASEYVVDFLVDDVLDACDPADRRLMLRCSVLERLCGPVCDAVLGRDDSGERLRELARSNLFLQQLDDRGQWYRFHQLFAQLLRAQLAHEDAGLLPTLHGRAYAWHRDNGSTDEAVEHALAAEAFPEAGEVIAARWLEYVNAGRNATVLSWLDRLPSDFLDASATLLHVKAWVATMAARRQEAEQTIAALERLPGVDRGPLPDGTSSIEGSIATLRAAFPWDDVGAGNASALRATELEKPESPIWPHVCWARGWGHFFTGEFEDADPWLAASADAAERAGQWLVAGSALAYRSFVADEQGDVDRQVQLAEQAMQLVSERGLEEIHDEAYVALGSALAARGELEAARPMLAQGVAGLRRFGHPVYLAHGLVRQARVLHALGDPDAADAVVAEARATVDSCPDPGILEEWVAALERPPRGRPRRRDGELSERELAVLRALSGPLSEREIGRELYLSHNTIHSHTRSIYRKLDVSSRAAAVRRAREAGLL